MNTTKKDTDQIAASTGKWLWNQRNKLSPSEFISRIKAAIEKATEAHKHAIEQDLPRRWESRLHEWERKQPFDSRTKLACDVLSECLTELRMSRAACASEPWTPQMLSRLFDAECSPEQAIERICSLHNATLQPARASEQGAGYRLAKLLRDEYWAQTPLDVAKLADEVLSQRPTPATASE